ncbi:MAG: hypothetical protein ACI3X1_07655 [Eubacteriales bacterium]
MRFTNEMIEKAKAARNEEEMLELAKAENIEMTAEEAAKYFAELHKTGELEDDELDNVAGGCSDSLPKYSEGQRVYTNLPGRTGYGTVVQIIKKDSVYQYKIDYDNLPDAIVPEKLVSPAEN